MKARPGAQPEAAVEGRPLAGRNARCRPSAQPRAGSEPGGSTAIPAPFSQPTKPRSRPHQTRTDLTPPPAAASPHRLTARNGRPLRAGTVRTTPPLRFAPLSHWSVQTGVAARCMLGAVVPPNQHIPKGLCSISHMVLCHPHLQSLQPFSKVSPWEADCFFSPTF